MPEYPAEIALVTAGNTSDYTLEGTNTWIVGNPGCDDAVLIDPGPDDPQHIDAVESVLSARRMRLRTVVLTHAHDDHIGNLWRFVTRTPELRVHSMLSNYPEAITVGNRILQILRTPGHTHDSVCLWEEAAGYLFTGDMVLGDGPTMIDYPDGSVSDYLESLRKLQSLSGLTQLFPGHGRSRNDPYEALQWNRDHRLRRVDDVADVADRFDGDAEAITTHIYPHVTPELRVAALQNTRAALNHLDRAGGAAKRDLGPPAHSSGEV